MADAELKFANPDTDLDILAPKKINWDLKMQFEPKQRLLQRQTHKALLEIVREKVAANGARQGEQLAQAVAQAQSVASDDEDEEDENDVDEWNTMNISPTVLEYILIEFKHIWGR